MRLPCIRDTLASTTHSYTAAGFAVTVVLLGRLSRVDYLENHQ